MMTQGLVARETGGVLKIFDMETGEEVTDIAQHQLEYAKRVGVILFGIMNSLVTSVQPPSTQAANRKAMAMMMTVLSSLVF